MKDATTTITNTIHPTPVPQEVEECCGACRHMKYEDADGFGVCFKFDTPVYCGDDACKLFEESK